MTLAPDFTCGYDSQITVSAGTNVTIHGNGATLDAAKKGRFFTVSSGAALALDHMVLQNGHVNDDDVSARLHGLTSARKSPYTNSRHVLLLTKRHFSGLLLVYPWPLMLPHRI